MTEKAYFRMMTATHIYNYYDIVKALSRNIATELPPDKEEQR